MDTITAKQLHLETKQVLDQLERGDRLVVTRKGRVIARLEPVGPGPGPAWDEFMQDVWAAQESVAAGDRMRNPVLQERRHRR